MAGTLDKKMSQLGSLTKKEAIQSNGALIGFAGQGNFTIKVDDLTDVYFGDLSTSWEDIARAQAAGKLVFLRFEIPTLFATSVGPLKQTIPTLEKLNEMIWQIFSIVKEELIEKLPDINETLRSSGYDEWTEADIDALFDGTMPKEKFNEYREADGQEPVDDEEYAEYLSVNMRQFVTMDQYIGMMAENPLTSQIDVDVDIPISIEEMGIRIGIGLRYRADMPFVTPTYIAMGMPYIICAKVGEGELLDTVNGLGGSIFAGSSALFEVVIGLDVDFKDDGDPEGVVLDLGGEVTNMVIDSELIGETAGEVSSVGFSGDLTGILANVINLNTILEIINDVKITVSAELTFNAVLRLLRNGWEINFVTTDGNMIPGRVGFYGYAIEFSDLTPANNAYLRCPYILVDCEYDGTIQVFESPKKFIRQAIEFKEDMLFDDLFAAAENGCAGVVFDGPQSIWLELTPTEFLGNEAVLVEYQEDFGKSQVVGIPVEIEEDVYGVEFIQLGATPTSVVVDLWQFNGEPQAGAKALSVFAFYKRSDFIKVIDDEGYEITDVRQVYDENDGYLENDVFVDGWRSDGEYEYIYTYAVTENGVDYQGEYDLEYSREIVIDANGINTGSSDDLDVSGVRLEYFDENENDWIEDSVLGLLELVESGFTDISLDLGNRRLHFCGLDAGGGYTPRLLFSAVYNGVLYSAHIAINYNNGVHEGLISVHHPVWLENAWTSYTSEPDAASYTLDCMHKAMYNVALDNGTTTALTVAAPAAYSGALADELDKPIHQDEPVQAKCVITKDSTAGNTTLGITGVTVGAGPYTLEPSKKYVLDIFGPVAELHEVQ
jgi:hypothetical protein